MSINLALYNLESSVTFDSFTEPINVIPVNDYNEVPKDPLDTIACYLKDQKNVYERTLILQPPKSYNYFITLTFNDTQKSFSWKVFWDHFRDGSRPMLYYTIDGIEQEWYEKPSHSDMFVYHESNGPHYITFNPNTDGYQGPVTITFSQAMSFPQTYMTKLQQELEDAKATIKRLEQQQ